MDSTKPRRFPAALGWRLISVSGLAFLLAFCSALIFGGGARVSSQTREDARMLLRKVRFWGCQFQNLNIDTLQELPLDLLVVDPSLPEEQIERLKTKPDGGRRLVFAYMSVGEAEEYRSYWQSVWAKQPPLWLGKANPAWPQAHYVRYWQDEWQAILYKAKGSILGGIIAAGFDGAFLDRVDAYNDWLTENPLAKQNMVQLVERLASQARGMRPDFLLIGQNSEELLRLASYRMLIDAVSKESLLYGLHGENRKNTADDVAWSLGGLNAAKADGLPVLMIEYVSDPRLVEDVKRRAQKLGFTPFFANRLLDIPPLPIQ